MVERAFRDDRSEIEGRCCPERLLVPHPHPPVCWISPHHRRRGQVTATSLIDPRYEYQNIIGGYNLELMATVSRPHITRQWKLQQTEQRPEEHRHESHAGGD